MEIPVRPITLKNNVYAIDINCHVHSKENLQSTFFINEAVDSKILAIFNYLGGSHYENLKFPLILSKRIHKLKQSLKSVFHRKWPIFIIFISVVEIVFFCTSNEKFKRLLMYDVDHKEEIWRFFTYMLIHTDSVHLILNIIIQGLVGIPLELEQGRYQSATVYVGGGVGGSLAASAFPDATLMAGASGGIYALLLSQIPNAVLNYEDIKYAAQRIVIVVVLTAADVAYVSYHVCFHKNEGPRIAWVAHVSGAVTGLLIGFLIFKASSEWKRRFRTISFLLLLLLFVLGVIRVIYLDYFKVLIF